MKVVVFSTHIIWPQHYETELEIMQNHLNEGHEVVQLVCNASFGICDSNLDHKMLKCMLCTSRRKKGISLLDGKVRVAEVLDYTDDADRKAAEAVRHNFDSLDHLQEYHIGQYPIGYAVGSTLVSILRDSTLDVSSNNTTLRNLLAHAALSYAACKKFLEREQPDLVYIFNGRLPNPRAMLSACTEAGIPCHIHERGYNWQHYEVFKNRLPQDHLFIQELIREAWEQADEPRRSEVGTRFYTERRKGQEQGWISFVKDQKEGNMPEDWDPGKHNIVIFNSSEDEFISCTDDWKNKLYMSQYNAIRKICRELEQHPDVRVYLRCHPNLKGASEAEKKELESMKQERLVFIAPESSISTYALLDHASVVLTFNSTVGIEATFWDKPSILAGPSLYDQLGSNYIPTSHEEVMSLLLQRNLQPKGKHGALMYGYFFNSFGKPFRYFQPEHFSGGTFKGVDLLQPTRAYTLRKAIMDADPSRLSTRLMNRMFFNRIKGFKPNHFQR
jgi:hypothetical protein